MRDLYDRHALIDTSAVLAIGDDQDKYHGEARTFFEAEVSELAWFVLDVTAHETFTRSRYDSTLDQALENLDKLWSQPFQLLRFDGADEQRARSLIEKYDDHRLSFHDALCAAVMLREGISKVFTFDRNFWLFGFQIVPGLTH